MFNVISPCRCLLILVRQDPDVVQIWQSCDRSDIRKPDVVCTGRNGLVRLAIRVLSRAIAASSGGVERLLSDFGLIHTKQRNALALETVHKMASVRLSIKRDHAEQGIADRKSTRLNSSHSGESRMPSSA